MRAGRRRQPIGRNGKAHPRWIGGNLCVGLPQGGWVVGWHCAGANVPDPAFPPLIAPDEEERSVLRESAFPATEGDPANRKLWDRGLWNTRLLSETGLSRSHGVCHLQKVTHRPWAAFQMRLAFTLATFTRLVPWHGLTPDAQGFIHLS